MRRFIRLLSKSHLLAKIALLLQAFVVLPQRLYSSRLVNTTKACRKIIHFFEQSRFRKKSIFFLGFLCLGLVSCGKKPSGFDYKVAFDPSWYSLEMPGRESMLTAFTSELIEAIGKEENLKIGVYQRSWSNLMLGLQENYYQAICTPMQPYLFYEKLYVFSDIYLPTGPVLVVGANSPWNSLAQLDGHEVGIVRGTTFALILEKFPNIIQRTYDSPQAALDAVSQSSIEAMLLDILTAEAFTHDLYQGKVKISSAPLTQEGIRLVGLESKSGEFIRRFNRGLSKLKSNGTYSKIAQKWGLGEKAQ